jgi:SAM-dependent methyltransferase
MTSNTLDHERASAFNRRLVDVINSSSLALMISLGHRTGLFDVMAGLPAATVAEIAEAARLNERYVREWLGAMTVGRIVEHDAQALTYYLPLEHAAALTRSAGVRNMGPLAQFIPLLGSVEDGIVECFHKGGGLPYDAYPGFQRVMQERSDGRFEALLIDSILPLVEGLPERLASGIDVGDVGCGSGKALCLMAREYPRSRFTGFDFLEGSLEAGRAMGKDMGLENVRFEARDAAKLDRRASFDFITTFDAIHDQAHPDRVLAGIAAALRPDGVYLCADFAGASTHAGNMDHVMGPFMYTVSTMHCMSVSLAYDGAGLGAAWGEQLALRMLNDAGFSDVAIHKVRGDFINNYYLARQA